MPTVPSAIFTHFRSQPQIEWRRHEVASAALGALRKGMRFLIEALDAEEADPIPAARLRRQLFDWLTVPTSFREMESSSIQLLGSATQVAQRWGEDFSRVCMNVNDVLEDLRMTESPLRMLLDQVVRDVSTIDRTFVIICRRAAVPSFSKLEIVRRLEEQRRLVYLHSARDYRDVEPFDALVHVGPFRSRGYSSVPPGVLNAPRFSRLLQFVWEGLADEDGCANDPVMRVLQPDEPPTARAGAGGIGACHSASLIQSVVRHAAGGELTGHSTNVVDEIASLQSTRISRVETARAIVLHIDAGLAIPYASHSMVALLTGDGPSMAIKTAMAAEVPSEHAFLVWHDIDDVDIGGITARDGKLSAQWKERLRQEVGRDRYGLEGRLRTAGIDLSSMQACLRHWSQPATTVIHAPQQRLHFEKLISVLEVDSSGCPWHPRWWRVAWEEISTSRGEAIQSGMQEQDIIAEERQRILEGCLPELRVGAQSGETFRLSIPAGESLTGRFTLYRIVAVEHGFKVPLDRLRRIASLDETEEWRA